jgi:hypothetical protein
VRDFFHSGHRQAVKGGRRESGQIQNVDLPAVHGLSSPRYAVNRNCGSQYRREKKDLEYQRQ